MFRDIVDSDLWRIVEFGLHPADTLVSTSTTPTRAAFYNFHRSIRTPRITAYIVILRLFLSFIPRRYSSKHGLKATYTELTHSGSLLTLDQKLGSVVINLPNLQVLSLRCRLHHNPGTGNHPWLGKLKTQGLRELELGCAYYPREIEDFTWLLAPCFTKLRALRLSARYPSPDDSIQPLMARSLLPGLDTIGIYSPETTDFETWIISNRPIKRLFVQYLNKYPRRMNPAFEEAVMSSQLEQLHIPDVTGWITKQDPSPFQHLTAVGTPSFEADISSHRTLALLQPLSFLKHLKDLDLALVGPLSLMFWDDDFFIEMVLRHPELRTIYLAARNGPFADYKSAIVYERTIDNVWRPRRTFQRDLHTVMRTPTTVDVERARQNLKEGFAALETIESRIEKMRTELADLERQRDKLKEDIRLNSSISTTLRTIPYEVLSTIFELYLEGYASSPWTLMGVCRQWRATAIQTKKLWSRILISNPSEYRHGSRWKCGEICSSPELLQRALDRAGGAKLDVSLQYNHSYPRLDDRGFYDQVRSLQANDAHRRIRSLNTQACSAQWMRQAKFDGLELPALESAYLTTASRDIKEHIFKTTLRLRFLSLTHISGDKFDWDLSSMCHLEELNLAAQGSYSFHTSNSCEAVQMILSVPRLTRLQLKRITISTGIPLSTPSLSSLDLDSTTIQCGVTLPNLQTLTMGYSMIVNNEADPLVLPSLKHLVIKSCREDDHLYIQAPVLESLELDFSGMASVERILQNSILVGQMSPIVFRLDTKNIPAELLSTLLTNMPRLGDFGFKGTIASPKSFFDKLAGRSLGAGKGRSTKFEPLCPSLKSIRLNSHGSYYRRKRYDVKATERWYLEAIQARNKGKYPIREAWNWDEGIQKSVAL
ncbi:hypothetical protein FRC17_000474 [Serendipita sp. 399]|nr:hypothetical protein FRC17_000474 [Serendipita sp. 399]